MTETIGILIIFFVLIVFGLIFYSNFQKTAFNKQKEAFLEKDAIGISLKTTYLPELSCEQTGGKEEVVGSCIDMHKLKELKSIINNDYYTNLFGSSEIYFKDILKNKTYSLYNASTNRGRTRVTTPILLRNVTENKDHFGVLYVDVYN